MKKSLLSVLVAVAVLMTTLFTIVVMPASAEPGDGATAEEVTYTVSTFETAGLAAGDTFTIELSTNAVADLGMIEYYLAYDNSLVKATAGTYTGVMNSYMLKDVVIKHDQTDANNNKDGDAATGEIWITGMCNMTAAVPAEGVFATITFEALTDITENVVMSAISDKCLASTYMMAVHNLSFVDGGVEIAAAETTTTEEVTTTTEEVTTTTEEVTTTTEEPTTTTEEVTTTTEEVTTTTEEVTTTTEEPTTTTAVAENINMLVYSNIVEQNNVVVTEQEDGSWLIEANGAGSVGIVGPGSYDANQLQYTHIAITSDVPFGVAFYDAANGKWMTSAGDFSNVFTGNAGAYGELALWTNGCYTWDGSALPADVQMSSIYIEPAAAGQIVISHLELAKENTCDVPAPALPEKETTTTEEVTTTTEEVTTTTEEEVTTTTEEVTTTTEEVTTTTEEEVTTTTVEDVTTTAAPTTTTVAATTTTGTKAPQTGDNSSALLFAVVAMMAAAAVVGSVAMKKASR